VFVLFLTGGTGVCRPTDMEIRVSTLKIHFIGFEVLTALTVRNTAIGNVTPCSPVDVLRNVEYLHWTGNIQY
jgi:hypothetical protein